MSPVSPCRGLLLALLVLRNDCSIQVEIDQQGSIRGGIERGEAKLAQIDLHLLAMSLVSFGGLGLFLLDRLGRLLSILMRGGGGAGRRGRRQKEECQPALSHDYDHQKSDDLDLREQ